MSQSIPTKKGGVAGVCQVNPDSIPDELKEIAQWVVWNWDMRPDKDGINKLTKTPIDPHTKQPAKTNDPDTWGTFTQALELHTRWLKGGGIGFVFTGNDPYCGIDIDKCRDKESGEMTPRAMAILRSFPTYAEISPSGTGVKLLLKGQMPGARNRKDGIEIYDRGRFFTITGDIVQDHPCDVVDCQEPLLKLHQQLFSNGVKTEFSIEKPKTTTLNDSELLRKIRGSKQGDKFESLWNGHATVHESRSEADLALVNILMFWCGGDESRVDGLFRQSGLYREKWEREDYRRSTFDTALANRDGFFDPEFGKDKKRSAMESFDIPANVPEINISDIATLYDLEAAGAGTSYFWPKWIQNEVVNLFASPGGLGKSRCILDIIKRIKFGLPWPDGQPMNIDGKDFRSLWVLADNHHNQMVTVAKQWDIMDKVWVNAYKSNPFDGTMLETNEDLLSLFAICKTLQPHLVVVDTVGGSTAKNLAKQEDAMLYYNPLMKMAREFKCPFICICHVSANGQVYGVRSRERARSVIQMAMPNAPNDEKRRVWVEKSTDHKPPALGMYMTEDGAEYDDDPPELPEGYGNPLGMMQGGNKSQKRERPSRQHECNLWLHELLTCGDTPVNLVLSRGESKGFKKEELQKAIAVLVPVVKREDGKDYYWLDPATAPPTRE